MDSAMVHFLMNPSVINGFSKIKISGFIINALAICNFAWQVPGPARSGAHVSFGLVFQVWTGAFFEGSAGGWTCATRFQNLRASSVGSARLFEKSTMKTYVGSINLYTWGKPIKLHRTQRRFNTVTLGLSQGLFNNTQCQEVWQDLSNGWMMRALHRAFADSCFKKVMHLEDRATHFHIYCFNGLVPSFAQDYRVSFWDSKPRTRYEPFCPFLFQAFSWKDKEFRQPVSFFRRRLARVEPSSSFLAALVKMRGATNKQIR